MPVLRLAAPDDWPTLGWDVIDWTEAHLCHGPGDVQGESLVWDDEQARWVLDLYRLYPKGHAREGRRVYHTAEISRPKGRAKSEFAGALVCAELAGPVRFDGWDANGDPVGRPVRYPFIRCLATEEGQAGNTYDNVRVMLEHANEQSPDEFPVDVGLTRVVWKAGDGGEVRPSTASGAAKDGGKETFAVADETHLYVLPELRRMYDTVRRNTRKRKGSEGWMLSTTTAFDPGQESVAEANRTHAEDLLERGVPATRAGAFYDHRQSVEVVDWEDDDELLAALAELYGPAADWMDLEGVLQEIRHPLAMKADSQRYWFNQSTKGEQRAVSPEQWDRLAAPDRTPTPDLAVQVVGFFDGSKGTDSGRRIPDSTGLVLLTREERPHLFVAGLWEFPGGNVWKVPRDEVRATVAEVFESFTVDALACDPPGWQEQIDAWHSAYGDAVMEVPTMSGQRFGPMVDRFLEAVAEGTFTHSGDPRLRRHVLNAILGKTRAGGWSALVKETESRKIDLAVCAAGAIGTLALLEEEPPAPSPFVIAV